LSPNNVLPWRPSAPVPVSIAGLIQWQTTGLDYAKRGSLLYTVNPHVQIDVIELYVCSKLSRCDSLDGSAVAVVALRKGPKMESLFE
jgi:hypothetical protein